MNGEHSPSSQSSTRSWIEIFGVAQWVHGMLDVLTRETRRLEESSIVRFALIDPPPACLVRSEVKLCGVVTMERKGAIGRQGSASFLNRRSAKSAILRSKDRLFC